MQFEGALAYLRVDELEAVSRFLENLDCAANDLRADAIPWENADAIKSTLAARSSGGRG